MSEKAAKRDLVTEAAVKAKVLQVDEIKRIKAAWDKFDLNGDGEVSIEEVKKFLSEVDNSIPESAKEGIIKNLDRNRNGKVEFVEFVLFYEKDIYGKSFN